MTTKQRKTDDRALQRRVKTLRTQVGRCRAQGWVQAYDRRRLRSMVRNLLEDLDRTGDSLQAQGDVATAWHDLEEVPLGIAIWGAAGARVDTYDAEQIAKLYDNLQIGLLGREVGKEHAEYVFSLFKAEGLLGVPDMDEVEALVEALMRESAKQDLEAQAAEWGAEWEERHKQLWREALAKERKRLLEERERPE